jgi:TolB protein
MNGNWHGWVKRATWAGIASAAWIFALRTPFAGPSGARGIQTQATLQASEEAENPSKVRSSVTIYNMETKAASVVYTADKLWEAPNWSPDGKYLLANSGGALYRIPLKGDSSGAPQKLPLDDEYRCNNDHGLTRNGRHLAFSATFGVSKGSQVFLASVDGSHPRLLTANEPSYFHSWSPDGLWLAFVAERGGPPFRIYRIAASGGKEDQLTSLAAFDDGPDYSPDGKWIYFNSNRANGWDIWRMPADGAGPNDAKAERVTGDEWEDWFPHPSPDGKWLVFLSFPHGTPGHNVKTNVELRMIPVPSSAPGVEIQDAKIIVLTSLFGGQGTVNVNSWAPDSKRFAYVSYERLLN